jgi:hypothetical protein
MASNESSGLTAVFWLVFLFLHTVIAVGGGCSPSEKRFDAAMKAEGYTDAERHGYDWFECGSGDWWVEQFTAKQVRLNEDGKKVRVSVHGTMCCGIFKGCTVRWY